MSSKKTSNEKSTSKKVAKKTSSKKNTNRKGRTKKKNKKKRLIGLSIFLVLSVIALVGILGFYLMYGEKIKGFEEDAKELVAESSIDTFRQSQTSLVYDYKKELVSMISGEKDVQYVNFNDIPKYFYEAMISIEDKKFLSHTGVDLKANVRAVVSLVKNKGEIKQGASTITQQLARNIFLTHEVSYERKLKEIFLALEIEKEYSKTQIMEFYLNNIYFANGYYGIGAAANGYFNREVDELSLSEIVFLCAIPNNPTIYNPLNKMENTIGRRNRILKQMYNDGKISKSEYNDAKNEEIVLDIQQVEKINYVETFVFYSATRALMEKEGFVFRNQFSTEEDRASYEEQYDEMYSRIQKSIYTKGYRIYTAIDLEKQSQLQLAVDNELSKFEEVNDSNVYALQGAAVTIDNQTGKVVAIVGGRSQDLGGYTLNRAYQSYRQPGSSIKPVIVYAPAFERGYYPDTKVVDEKFEGGPSNANNKYSGEIDIRTAVQSSKNTIAWKLFEEITPKVGLEYLLKMNFNKISKNDYYPASSLGGMTNGVSPLEITSAFATLANDGLYRVPTTILQITDAQGNVLVDKTLSEETRIYDANSARMTTDVLESAVKVGTGKGLGVSNMPSAGKTGTTNDKKDGWFVGYTPYYTTGVWVGYDIPRAMSDLSGASYPGRIWKNYMNVIHEGLERVEFIDYLDTRPSPTPTPTPTIEPTPIEEETDILDEGVDGELEIPVDEIQEEPQTNEEEVTKNPKNPKKPKIQATPTPTVKPTVAPTIEPEPENNWNDNLDEEEGFMEDPYVDWGDDLLDDVDSEEP